MSSSDQSAHCPSCGIPVEQGAYDLCPKCEYPLRGLRRFRHAHPPPAMRRAGGGSIINIASLAAVFGLPYGLDYVASKAAVIGMTRAMARELGPDHIRVNAVAPSAVMTEGTAEFFGAKFEKAKSVIASNQLIPRNLEPQDLTGTIVYLASDASRFVTGQTHMVDGGSWFL